MVNRVNRNRTAPAPKQTTQPTLISPSPPSDFSIIESLTVKGSQCKHVIKLFSVTPHDHATMLELESYLIVDDHNYDLVLIPRATPTLSRSDKIRAYQTDIDIAFEDICHFFRILYKTKTNPDDDGSAFLMRAIVDFHKVNLSDTFHEIYSTPTIDHSAVAMILDLVINAFEKIYNLKLIELNALCTLNKFPLAFKPIIFDRINLIHHLKKALLECAPVERIKYLARRLDVFSLKLIAIKEDYEIANILNQCIQPHLHEKSPIICVVSDFMHHRILEALLLHLDDGIQFEKYYANPMKTDFQMIPAPKLNVTKHFTVIAKSKAKKKKKKSRKPVVIKFVKGTGCIDEFEMNLIASTQPNKNHLLIIKGIIENASIPIITYFDEIDWAFEKLVHLLSTLKYPTRRFIVNLVLPQILHAIFQIPQYIFDRIHAKLYEKHIDKKEFVYMQIRYLFTWIHCFWNANQEYQVSSENYTETRSRPPSHINKPEATDLIFDLLLFSLQELYALKFKRILYDIKHGYKDMMALIQPPYDSLHRHIAELERLQAALQYELPKILHEIALLDPRQDYKRIESIFAGIKNGIGWSCAAFGIWKGELDILWELYQWKLHRNCSDAATIIVSTWVVEQDSVFVSVIRKILGNDTII